ncbi:UNVERIFIED_CONTAM: hypothetical protein PYX00_011533 [Menopon gallinae]|uniref:Uncharacterized protein n=1 Tax=Menopon gallinae TaxID=328185 RepID=A0AAW2H888_9NEOP
MAEKGDHKNGRENEQLDGGKVHRKREEDKVQERHKNEKGAGSEKGGEHRAGGEEQEKQKDKGSSKFGEYGELIKQKSHTMKSGAKSAFAKTKDAASSIKNKFSKAPEDKK